MKLNSLTHLRKLYPTASGRAAIKTLPALETHSRRFIEHSPMVMLATVNQQGALDCSPRGGVPGFVKIVNDRCLVIPDAKGNNRLDSLTNIIVTGQVGCLFLLPGMDETLRVNGRASISIAPAYLAMFANQRHRPVSVIEVEVTEVFMHCAKALMRSKLWDPASHIHRGDFPTMGQILKDQLKDDEQPESQEAMVQRYLEQL